MNTFRQAGLADQQAGLVSRLVLVDFPANNLAAEYIQYQLQAVERTTGAGGQIR